MTYDVSDFEKEVRSRSFSIPVLVDFWAEWCAPCKILGPILEKLFQQSGGRWMLAKVNTEEFPDVTAEYRISSIPNVKLFVDGNVVSEFLGALTEHQIAQWLQKTLPSRFQKQIERAAELLAKDCVPDGTKLLEDVLESEPENQQANVLLATTLVFSEPEKAASIVAEISDSKHVEIAEAVRTFARLFQLNPNDLPNQLVKQQYLDAIAKVRSRNYTEALEMFIGIIRNGRYYDDDGSRKACIAIFKFLGEEHEITLKYRREFSSALY